jgi:hypothetical protein
MDHIGDYDRDVILRSLLKGLIQRCGIDQSARKVDIRADPAVRAMDHLASVHSNPQPDPLYRAA